MTENVEEVAMKEVAAQIKQAEDTAKEFRTVARQMMPEEASAAADSAKAQGAEVFGTQVGEEWYVYRTLSRFEYQNMLLEQAKVVSQLSEQADSDMALNIMSKMREQNDTVIKAMVWPHLDSMNIKTVPAGAIDTLYNAIMIACGFGQEPIPIKL